MHPFDRACLSISNRKSPSFLLARWENDHSWITHADSIMKYLENKVFHSITEKASVVIYSDRVVVEYDIVHDPGSMYIESMCIQQHFDLPESDIEQLRTFIKDHGYVGRLRIAEAIMEIAEKRETSEVSRHIRDPKMYGFPEFGSDSDMIFKISKNLGKYTPRCPDIHRESVNIVLENPTVGNMLDMLSLLPQDMPFRICDTDTGRTISKMYVQQSESELFIHGDYIDH